MTQREVLDVVMAVERVSDRKSVYYGEPATATGQMTYGNRRSCNALVNGIMA